MKLFKNKTEELSEDELLEHAEGPDELSEEIAEDFENPEEEEEKEKDEEIEKELKAIYLKDGKMPNFKKFEHRGGSRTKLFLIGLVAFFAVLALSAWAGFFILKPYERFGGKGVGFEIKGPDAVVSGQETEFQLSYQNNEDVPLSETSVKLLLNPGLIIKETTPEQTEPGEWTIGSVDKNGKGSIIIKAIIIGEKESKAMINGSFLYRPANFNSEFEKIGNFSADIKATVLNISAEIPANASPGDEINYKIKYKNLSDKKIERVAGRPVLPAEFVITSSTLPLDREKIWKIGDLEPEEEGEIGLQGVYSSEASGTLSQKFEIGFMIEGDKFVPQESAEGKLEIQKSDLILSLLANGERNGTANFGDTLNYFISFKNDGQDVLENMVLKVIYELKPIVGNKSPLVWSSLDDDYGAETKFYELKWDKKDLSKLGRLAPGESATLEYGVDAADYPVSDENHEIVARAEILVGKRNGEDDGRTAKSSETTLKINSDLEFQAQGRYYNDENIAVGSGPLPPEVGAKTTIKVFWKLQNSLHDLESINVSATLPAGVKWENVSYTENGNIGYDEASRKVTWRIDRFGKSQKTAETSFSISITPEFSDVGKIITLLTISGLRAQDSETGGIITKTQPGITTELIGDPEMEGRGMVE